MRMVQVNQIVARREIDLFKWPIMEASAWVIRVRCAVRQKLT